MAPDSQILGDIAWRACAALAEHPHSGTDLPRRAIAALKAVVLYEGRLQRVQRFTVGEPLYRRDRLAVMHCGERQAGVDATAVQQHGASAALAMIAPLLGTCQREMFTQGVKKRCPRIERHTMEHAVDLKFDVYRTDCRLSIGRLGG